jgi:TolB protein
MKKPLSLALAVTVLAGTGACGGHRSGSAGAVIAFTSRRGGFFSLYTVRPDGSRLRKIIDITSIADAPHGDYLDLLGQPAWSPDGSKIVFTCFPGDSEICAVNADGTRLRRLTYHPQPDNFPSWSPDGTQIAFARFVGHEYEIFTMRTDGTDLRQLTHMGRNASPHWSPDGKEILFISDRTGNSTFGS